MDGIEAFLSELARAVQRYGMYPEGHPARNSTADEVHGLLLAPLREGGELTLTVTRDRVVCGEYETDPEKALLAGFAHRVHSHQLHRITFREGIAVEELDGLLGVLAVATGASGEPFGASSPEELARWPHIALEPVPYDALTLDRGSDDGEEERASDVLAGAGGQGSGSLTTQTGAAGDGEDDWSGSAGPLQSEIAALLGNLEEAGRDRLRDAFQTVLGAEGVEADPERAVARLIERARSSGGEDRAAATMLGLVSRIGKRFAGRSGGRGVSPGRVLEELVTQLDSPADPGETAEGTERIGEKVQPVWVGPIEPERILTLGIELAEITPPARRAMKELVEGARAGSVAAVLDDAPAGNAGAEAVREWFGRPKTLRRLISGEPPDFSAIDRLLQHYGSIAAEPLIAVLIESEEDKVRAGLARRLISLGEEIGPLVLDHLGEPDPRVRSAMLAILAEFPALPEDFHPSSHYLDDDREVRRQALDFGLRLPGERERVLFTALRDPDAGIVSFALEEISRECPPELVPRLVRMATDRREPAAMRRAGIRALGYADSPEVLEALIDLTWQRRVFFLYRLAPKSSEMLEALEILFRNYGSHARVRRIVTAARKAKDPQIKTIANRIGRGTAQSDPPGEDHDEERGGDGS